MTSKAIDYKQKHEFALFIESLSEIVQDKYAGDSLLLFDEKLMHRMVHVLRLKAQDHCVLFDRHVRVSVIIDSFVGKKQVAAIIESVQKTVVLKPSITFLLPVLKRDDYESALYALTEVGVNVIQLVFTQKTTHQWSGTRDRERAERMLIAAAEQSKNFMYPELKEPISLAAALEKYNNAGVKIFFDPDGEKLFDVMQILHDASQNVVLLVGPEGDLSLDEKEMVQVKGFIFCALTPTVMRAFQAATLGAGFVRSLLVSTAN